MGCVYSDFEGRCNIFEKGEVNSPMDGKGDGICVYEDDPDPSISCETYESDSMCMDCGADFNQDEDCAC